MAAGSTETIGTADPSHSGPGQSHVCWRLWSYFIETAEGGVGAGGERSTAVAD